VPAGPKAHPNSSVDCDGAGRPTTR
jgi:hypothetical protein